MSWIIWRVFIPEPEIFLELIANIDTGENYLNHLLSILSNAAPANTKLIIRGENAINWKGLSAEKKILIYRILQELMVNMKKHSNASFVAIIFRQNRKLFEYRLF